MGVRTSVDLRLDRSSAFEAVVEEMSTALSRLGMQFQPGADGRVMEGVVEVGRVVRWQPPEEIVLEWHAADWQPAEVTSLGMRFEPVGDGTGSGAICWETKGMSWPAGSRARLPPLFSARWDRVTWAIGSPIAGRGVHRGHRDAQPIATPSTIAPTSKPSWRCWG